MNVPLPATQPAIRPSVADGGRRFSRIELIALLTATFALGVFATWASTRLGHEVSPIAESAAATARAGASASTQAPARPALANDLVQLSEASRSGRILTEQARLSATPQTGALPGKLVVDENRTARLAAPVTGRVVKLLKEPGDRVAAGEVLAMIDSPELSTVQAEARKAQVEANLKASAEQRMRDLHAAGAVALKELEAARAEAAEALGELDRTHTRLRQLNSLGRNSNVYSLLSPISGIVTERSVTLGQQVRAEEALNLFVVSDLRHLTMVLDAPEAQSSRMAVGQTLKVVVDGQESAKLDATIVRIGPSVDPATRRVQIRAAIANDLAQLRPEMFVRAFGTDAKERLALELPVSTLATRGSESAIFVERQPGTYERVAVQVQAQHPERVWVTPLGEKAVAPGARVVSQGALLLDSEIASR